MTGAQATIAGMARPRTASIRPKTTKLGTSYGLRISWQGRQIYHHLGGSWEGWTEERVEAERTYILAQAERGEYVPPVAPAAPVAKPQDGPTFQVFASVQMARWRRRLAAKTADDLEWRLRTAMDHFGQMVVGEIDVVAADRFVDSALREREAIQEAAAAGAPLTESYIDPRTGRSHQRRRRGLSNSSINKVLVSVRRVLKEAVRQSPDRAQPAGGSRLLSEGRDTSTLIPPACAGRRLLRGGSRARARAPRVDLAGRASDPCVERAGCKACAPLRRLGHPGPQDPAR